MTTENIDSQAILGSPLIEALAAIAQVAGVLIGGPGAAATGSLAVLQQASLAEVRPTLVTIAEAMEASRRGILSSDEWDNIIARTGYSERASDVFRQLRQQLLNVGELVQLRLRSQLDAMQYLERMHQLGYDETTAIELYSLADYIPQPQDVVRFAVREVYSPAIAERFGQFEDFPEDAIPDAARAGVSRETLRKYWAAHWDLPSISLVFDMYHRRAETGVQLADVELLLRAQDMMPFWRDKIIAVATHPYTRVDIRRMHKLGVLTDEQLQGEYVALGYSDARAEALARFTRELNGADRNAELEPFRVGLRSRALSMYQRAAMSRSALTTILTDLGHSAEEVSAFIAEAEFIRQADASDELLSQLQKLYVQGYWTLERVVERMTQLGYSRNEVLELVPVWDAQRELRELTAEQRHEKDLTRADVIGAYTDGLLQPADAKQHLKDLGYEPDEVKIILGRADIAKAKAHRTETEATLHTLYSAKRVTEAEARSQLGELGVQPKRVDMLLRRWDAEHQAKTPTLTVAQIQRAYAHDFIDEADARERLAHQGYNAADVEVLLQLAGVA